MTLDHLNSLVFAEHLNTTFRLTGPDSTSLALELVQVTDKDPEGPVEQFSLIFQGPATPNYPQGIYPVKHESLGALELFFVPLGPEGSSMRYQVIFCRMRKDKS